MNIQEFRVACNKAKNVTPFAGTLLSLDPGELTGWSSWVATETTIQLTDAGHLPCWPLQEAISNLARLLVSTAPMMVVWESYHVYQWKSQSHSWSDVPTVQIIGTLQTLLHQHQLPFKSQTAQQAKHFCTDQRLREWGLWLPGKKHARDAIRHAMYFLLFG